MSSMYNENSVWIVDDDDSIRWVMQKALENHGIACRCFDSAGELLRAIGRAVPKVIVTDIRMPHKDGFQLIKEISADFPNVLFIIMTAHSDLDSAVNAYQKGAFDYLPKPFDIDHAVNLVKRALEQAKQNPLSDDNENGMPSTPMIGAASAMQDVFRTIGRLSRSSISVLINGESGTGKELVAQALHQHSPRSNEPFVALNMAAIPAELIESELFGHEKGAFTGAQAQRNGRFEQANGGTLFLDEIGDMPLSVQTRLLRVLADGQFYRVGGQESINVDVRIIAATHQDLEQRVEQGKFREDLFHRLNVIRIQLPRLSERIDDIPLLTKHFLNKAAAEFGVECKTLHIDTERLLCTLTWPGNVRQLENLCRSLTVMASGKHILVSDLPDELIKDSNVSQNRQSQTTWQSLLGAWGEQQLLSGNQDILDSATLEVERVLLEKALNYTQGHKQEAARRLGWGRNTLTRKLKELKIREQ